jgi:DNA polymerase-3 subunit chi
VRVDFYQLSRDPVEQVLPRIAGRILEEGERLLIVSDGPDQLDRISGCLWDAGPSSFLAHDRAGCANPQLQPILLSTSCDAPNGASRIALVDGRFREDALAFARTFYFFDESTIKLARTTWRDLGKREGADIHFWRQDGGKWRMGP